LMDVISQLFAFTTNIKELLAPASTVIASPLWEAPNAIGPR
jgi:hypothetical protein